MQEYDSILSAHGASAMPCVGGSTVSTSTAHPRQPIATGTSSRASLGTAPTPSTSSRVSGPVPYTGCRLVDRGEQDCVTRHWLS
eukprot:scaffold593_cov382-Prasinococcus_capsulatus_cf.AAC.4